MTKRHFDRLAAELALVRPSDGHWDNGPDEFARQWELCVGAVADACRASNPRFDRTKFQAACKGWDKAKAIAVCNR